MWGKGIGGGGGGVINTQQQKKKKPLFYQTGNKGWYLWGKKTLKHERGPTWVKPAVAVPSPDKSGAFQSGGKWRLTIEHRQACDGVIILEINNYPTGQGKRGAVRGEKRLAGC